MITPEQIIEIIEESMFDCYPQWRNLTPSDLPIVAEKIASLINTAKDEPQNRYERAKQKLANMAPENKEKAIDELSELFMEQKYCPECDGKGTNPMRLKYCPSCGLQKEDK